MISIKQNLWLITFFTLAALLITVQGAFLLYPEKYGELRAERFQSLLITAEDKLKTAEENIAGLTVYLTVETADGTAAPGEIKVNGVSAGHLENGVLMFRCKEGDKITLTDTAPKTYLISEANGFIDTDLLPPTCRSRAGTVLWGKVHFK